MFGYVRPVLDCLKAEEKEAYKSVYCGLCHTLGKRHGWVARLTLNYDFALLALLHYGADHCKESVCCRCPVHPLRKARVCISGNALERAADQSVILTWHKLCDDIDDNSFLLGVLARAIRMLLKGGYKVAVNAQPEFDASVRENLNRLRKLEAENSPMLDRVADTFAAILASASSGICDLAQRRAMEQLLYHLGRWIYLIDAWDDLEEDRRKSRYNALNVRFEGRTTEERDYVETTMTHSIRLVCSAANLLDFGTWKPIVENLVYYGIPFVQQAVLEGRWKEIKKQGRSTHERSL